MELTEHNTLAPVGPVLPMQPEMDIEAVFSIRIGSLGFLISTATYCEVLDKVQVSALPNVHPWIGGLLNLRGNLVPVFDLQRAFEEKPSDAKKRRLFAMDRGEKAVAVWIDNFPEIKDKASLQASIDPPVLPAVLQRFVMGSYAQNGQIWLTVKFEELFKVLGQHQYATEEMAI